MKQPNYTRPELRERLKKKILAGGKGGKPGQWSARKAQLLALEYKQAGGGYVGNQRTKTQRSLERWTQEKWTTASGERAVQPAGTRRYLPARAWAKLKPGEKKSTNRKKLQGSRRGKQFVANTAAARRARRSASQAAAR